MKIQALFCRNSLKNIIYLLIDESTHEVICIDPFDAPLVAKYLQQYGLKLKYIFNTHEHWDHIRGNQELKNIYNCEIYSVPGVTTKDHVFQDQQTFSFSDTKFTINFTPGHTMQHYCIYASNKQNAMIFSGDMLFNAGVGNCKNGGNVEVMFKTFQNFFNKLHDQTKVYPGHDYIYNNLEFAKEREPNNKDIDAYIDLAKKHRDDDELIITTIGEEKKINPFMRLQSKNISERLQGNKHSDQETFLQLRSLRDSW